LIQAGTPKENITLLHATTMYPTIMSEVNLNAMTTMKNAFNISVGYSDHTLGIEVPVAAVALGASVIEKHFTLNKNMDGPDHKASLEPDELTAMVKAIRNIEMALGDGIKTPQQTEKSNMAVVRKSIVASRSITKGEILSEENLTVKRSSVGISSSMWDHVVGLTATCSFSKNDPIRF
jgi:N,N'-diacetyllegionaminate synthase